MSEDTTQDTPVEAPQGQAEPEANQGVEGAVVSPEGTDTGLQSQPDPDEAAEASLFDTIAQQKGWESPEDMAKAYREAEAELTRKAQSLSKSQNDYQAIEAVLEGLVNGDISVNEIAEDEPVTTPQPRVDDRTRKLEARLDVRTVAERHTDFAEMQPLMSQILGDTPNKLVFEGEKGVELLYKMARAEKMEQELAKAKEEGARQVTLNEVEKVRAAVADGTKAKQPGRKIFTAQEIGAMDPAVYAENREEIMKQYSEGLIK